MITLTKKQKILLVILLTIAGGLILSAYVCFACDDLETGLILFLVGFSIGFIPTISFLLVTATRQYRNPLPTLIEDFTTQILNNEKFLEAYNNTLEKIGNMSEEDNCKEAADFLELPPHIDLEQTCFWKFYAPFYTDAKNLSLLFVYKMFSRDSNSLIHPQNDLIASTFKSSLFRKNEGKQNEALLLKYIWLIKLT